MPNMEALEGLPHIKGPRHIPKPIRAGGISEKDPEVSASHRLLNLLLQAGTCMSLTPPSEVVYVGDGITPVPTKLAAKISKGQYIDMGELLPEFWGNSERRSQTPQRTQEL